MMHGQIVQYFQPLKFKHSAPSMGDREGFTLIEIMITLLLIGILFSIAAPSYLSWVNKKKVDDALTQVVGALKEAQREALRKGKGCIVTIDQSNLRITARTRSSATPPPPDENCLPTGNRDFTASNSNLQINTDFNGVKPLIFTHRKTTPNGGIIVLWLTDSSRQRCVVVSEGIGIIRTGYYRGDPTPPTTPSATNCNRNP